VFQKDLKATVQTFISKKLKDSSKKAEQMANLSSLTFQRMLLTVHFTVQKNIGSLIKKR